ncbi:TonB-dependent receptor [Sphingomonas panacisoli]|uniref:TonB-dependent receptor n=1 Tax=Sphingomonas panacisoli TaxID=1813879 RepID=A0A5B8LEE8_9SPHN|nr:TonB-dependent receptor [Sphingomonas panacisoli]QDZ06443.1 TonB-dependent receptor [Sphingomonas panacisoli]
MRNHLLIGAAVAALIMPAAAYAQETTSSIRGSVSANGAPVADARILITDVNSGTKVETGTDSSGNFNASGLRAGGPYSVEITSASGNTTVTDVYTVVGQPYDLPVDLTPSTAATAGDIVVTASSIKGAGVTSDGPQTVLKQTDISKVASVNRDIRDIERRDPFANLDLSNTRAVSFGGVNPRFNRFTINGVQIGDNFGLNSDANPTGRGPIPFDAIAQVSVSIAPYDIRQGNFVGGAIDTVMRSGSNKWQGTTFYSSSTDNLQGKRIGSTTITVPNYNSKTYGAELSGALIKDRLFFMVAAERNTDPRPFSPSAASQVPGLTDATVANVVNIAKSVYNYDAGSVLAVNNQKDEKIVGKIDLNITTGQRLSFSYINAFESADVLNNTSQSTSAPSLGLSSDAYTRSVLVRAGIVQLNSDWTDSLSTEIRGLYKSNRVNQTPMNGLGFAQFRVCTDPTSIVTSANTVTNCGSGTAVNPIVAFGPDISRQANQLFFDTWAGSFLGRYTTGGHEFKLLFEMSENRTFNLFQQYVTGAYYFDSIADFQNRSASTFDYANAVSLNTPDVAANFKYTQYTFGLQDDWKVNDTLTVTYGVRYDLYGMRSTPALNTFFLGRNGFDNTKTYKGLGNFQPRIGFNWKPTTGLKVRGGVGIFGGGSPDIYMSNSFSNTGVLANRISTVQRATPGVGTVPGSQTTSTCLATSPYVGTNAPLCTTALNGVTGNTIPGAINTYLSTATASLQTAPVNALAKNFKLPSVWKANLSVDYKIFGIGIGADYLFSKTRQAVAFTDLRSVVNTACAACGVLPDGRTRYNYRPTAGVTGVGAGLVNGDTNSDFLLYNTTRGRSHLADIRITKDFDWGLSLAGSYTWTDVKDQSPATSSTASSLYSNAAMADPNIQAYGISADQIKWSFKYSVGFDHAFFGDYRTVIQLFGETRAGRPYSFTMQNNNGTRSPVFGTIGNTDRYLLYVPTGAGDTKVSYDTQATADALDTLINASNLKNYRGMIAPKNIARNRAFTRIDLHLEQEIPTFVGGSRISLFADIENLPNLLNKNWGGLRQFGFPQTAAVVQVTCLTAPVVTGTAPTAAQTSTISTACAQYRYSGYRTPNESAVSTSNSLYLIRVGARFSF